MTCSTRKRPLLAVLVVGALLLAPPGATAQDTEDVLRQAEEKLAAGDGAAAAALLRDALPGASKDDAPVLASALGRALILSGEPYAALQHLQRAADLRGTAEDHLRLSAALLGIARVNLGDAMARSMDVVPYLEDALEAAGRASGAGAIGARRSALVGEARYWAGDPEAALEAWGAMDASLLPEPEAVRLADLQARACYTLGRYGEAADAFQRAGNLHGSAAALAAARKGPEAMAAYGRLLAADPGNEALLEEAFRAARYASAETELAGLLADLLVGLEAEGATAAQILVTRGLLAESTGALRGAVRLLEAATRADPGTQRAWFELGRVRLTAAKGRDDEVDGALDAFLKALDLDPGDERLKGVLWDLAGQDYAVAWRSPRARTRTLRIQEALVAADPENGLAWANLGNTRRVAGFHAEAVAAYDRAVAAEPDDPGIVSDRGLALSALGRRDEALAAFEAAVALDPDHDAAHQNAARILWLAGRDAEAEAHLAEAERRTRAANGNWMRYRFLLDRAYRTRTRPSLR